MARRLVFAADTSQFNAPVERSATVVRDLSKAMKEQERATRESFQQQIIQAKAAGASVEQLQEIEQQRYRSMLAIQAAQKQIAAESVSSGRAAVDTAEARAEAENLVTAAYEKQLLAVNATFGAIKKQHAEVGGSIAGGALIRTADGGQNVRAVENFLAKTLGLGGALQALFPLVGGVAFVQLLVEGGQKLYEMQHRAEEAGKALRTAMEDAHSKTVITIDDLNIQGDKIEENIAKLENKPRNGMKLAIDEAKKSADELLSQLIADRKELENILKESHVGPVDAWLSGTNPTGAEEKDILSRNAALRQSIQSTNTTYDKQLAGASTDEARKSIEASRRTALERVYKDAITSINGERGDLVKGNTVLDVDARSGQVSARVTNQNDARVGQLDYFRNQVESQLALMQARGRVNDLSARQDGLKGSADVTTIGNKAAEEQRKQWETDLKEQQAQGNMTLAQEREFWLARVQVVQTGSENWRVAYDHYLDASKKMNEDLRKQAAELRKINDEWGKAGMTQLLQAISPGAVSQSRGIIALNDSSRSLDAARSNAGYSAAEGNIRYQQQTKQITDYDAAMQLQTLHTQQYTEQLARLQEQLDAVQGTDDAAEARRNGIRQQIVGLNQNRAGQSNQDSLATYGGYTSGAVGARDALDDFVRSTRDAASQMRSIAESILGGINNNLSSAIVGGRTNWSDTFRGIGRQIANTGLQRLEGSVLGAFGFGGKPDGSVANPLNVRIVSSLGGAVGSVVSGAKSGFGGIISNLFGGFRADGGSVQAGKGYIVGERGPEPFFPTTSGTVFPNSALFGGGDTHNWNIDARGATDTAAIEQTFVRLITTYSPHIVRTAVSAVSESNRRKPLSAQR